MILSFICRYYTNQYNGFVPANISFRRELTLRASPKALWPLLASTDRIDRACGLPPVSYSPSGQSRLVRKAQARVLGPISATWNEPPFEWVEPQYYAVRRDFRDASLG